MKKIYLIAVVVAIITGIAVFLFAKEIQNNSTQSAQAEKVAVVVAIKDIAENTVITEDMLTTSLFPAETIPKTAVQDKNYLINKTAKYPVVTGEMFLTEKVFVIGDDQNTGFAERLQVGYRAYTISVDQVNGIAGYLKTGDKIDVIITKTVNGVSETAYCLQDVSIIAVGTAAQNTATSAAITEYDTVTLEVSPKDCLTLTQNLINGTVKIVLRGYGDK